MKERKLVCSLSLLARQAIPDRITEDKFDNAKYDLENDARDGVQDVENFPDNAARWTGEGVQNVEDIPERFERKWDNGVQDVEDVPEDISGWAGRRVGDVERFDDNIDNSYDRKFLPEIS